MKKLEGLANFEQLVVLNLNHIITNEVLVIQMSSMKAMKSKQHNLENIISCLNRIGSSTKI